MPTRVLNPYNKLDIERLDTQTTLDLAADLLAFADASASAPKNRKLTIQQLIDAILPTIRLAITPTGVIVPFAGLTAPSGWLLLSNLTIGSASSGATSRANADTAALYNLLWEGYSNAELVIQTSAGVNTTRGSNAATDYAANKRLPLLDLRGRVIAGLGNMGGTSADRITSAVSGFDGNTAGAAGGSQSHTLITDEIPAHTHDVAGIPSLTTLTDLAGSGANVASTPDTPATETLTSASIGGGLAHRNVQPTIILPFIIKL